MYLPHGCRVVVAALILVLLLTNAPAGAWPGSATSPVEWVIRPALGQRGALAAASGAPRHGESARVLDQTAPVELELVAGGFTNPLQVTNSGDGSGRLYVVEKQGVIRMLVGGSPTSTTFLDITTLVGSSAPEQGLLGLAFHPRYATNGFLYVNYTDRNGNTVVARYTAAPDRSRALPESASTVLTVAQPAANHNGGMLAFGPDGMLYLGMGDGGGGGDEFGTAQNGASLLGKMLRIDVDRAAPYAVPPSNPFVSVAGVRGEIWAFGVRNPWRFSFDRATGDLWIGDVGQGMWEEVNRQPAGSPGGENYGWPCHEGAHPFNTSATCALGRLQFPVAEYSHGEGCSVTGGYVYRGAALPSLRGRYVFGDFCNGRLWTLQPQANGTWQRTPFLDTAYLISSFGEDEAGELYLVDFAGGGLYRFGPGALQPTRADFDGNRTSDLAVYRPSNGTWYVRDILTAIWGVHEDVPVPGDYNGDGRTDIAVWRPSNGTWYIRDLFGAQWGLPGDIPVVGDYNGDGRTDLAVYRPSNGTWYIRDQLTAVWGQVEDIPVPGDYNGDGWTDLAVWRPSNGTWYIRDLFGAQWGLPGDIPVVGDFNGDGRTDLTVYRPSNGTWYVRDILTAVWGVHEDVPVPGDYNGDGRTDIAVWRPSNGTWYIRDLFGAQWGLPGDIPAEKRPMNPSTRNR